MSDTEEVAPGGDVVLICGEEEPRRIRVASMVLGMASPVFKSMFAGGRFKEGSELASSGTAEVKLPEDDAESMAVLCRIVHLRHRDVPSKMSVPSLLAISKLADKYDIYDAIMPTAEGWIRKSLDNPSQNGAGEDRKTLLLTAFYFHSPSAFECVSKDIVKKNCDMSREVSGMAFPATIENVLAYLEMERARILKQLGAEIEKMALQETLNCQCRRGICLEDCSYVQDRANAVINCMATNRIWPLCSLDVRTIEDIVDALSNPSWLEVQPVKCAGYKKAGCRGTFIDSIGYLRSRLKAAASVAKEVKAPCYRCAAAGEVFSPWCKHIGDDKPEWEGDTVTLE